MLQNQHVQVLLSLLIATNQVICLTDKLERFNYQKLARPDLVTQAHSSWQAQALESAGPHDKTDQPANHVHAPRASLIKPANNQIQASGFHPPTPSIVGSGTLHQANSNGAITRNRDLPVSSFSRPRNEQGPPHPNQQLSVWFGAGVNNVTPALVSSASASNEATQAGPPSNLELALRQVSGDESVFQPSPTIVAAGHNFDWFTQTPSAPQAQRSAQPDHHHHQHSAAASFSTGESRHDTGELATATASMAPPPTPPMTNEMLAKNATKHVEAALDDQQQQASTASLHDYYRDQQRSQPREPQANVSSSIEFNNQVIYEGPVTPPPSRDDYYFSSSERLPGGVGSNSISRNNNNYYNEQQNANSNAWW